MLTSRRDLLAVVTVAMTTGASRASTVDRSVGDSTRRAVELTFLKSITGERDRLLTFIERNWFEMDRIAKEQGLMAAYRLLDAGSDDGDWNCCVEVTYHDSRGYAGIAEAFERIRKAHSPVRIDGKGLRELGAIVGSRTVLERAAG